MRIASWLRDVCNLKATGMKGCLLLLLTAEWAGFIADVLDDCQQIEMCVCVCVCVCPSVSYGCFQSLPTGACWLLCHATRGRHKLGSKTLAPHFTFTVCACVCVSLVFSSVWAWF